MLKLTIFQVRAKLRCLPQRHPVCCGGDKDEHYTHDLVKVATVLLGQEGLPDLRKCSEHGDTGYRGYRFNSQ